MARPLLASVDRAACGDDGACLGVGRREDRVERLVDRVGEDVGAAHHGDAEHDGDGGQQGPAATQPQALQGDAPHRSWFSSETIWPSSSCRMRSAISAARGSCVTITVVWPKPSTAVRRTSRISWLVAESRLPVGSSANRTVGRVTQRACHRDALLLAARQLGRPVREPIGQADALDELAQPCLVDRAAGDLRRQQDVLPRGQHRQQVEELEDEADVLAAQLGQALVVEIGDLDAADRKPCRRRACRARRGCASASTCRSPTAP